MKHGRAEVVAICYCGMVTAEARESTCFKVEFLTASLWIWCFEVSSFDSQMHFATPSKKWAVLCLDWKQDDAILHGCLSEWMSKLPELALCWLDDHSEDAGCWWVAVAFENEFLYATIHFGTVDACWCEDLWTSFSAIQAPWLPLGLVYWILLSYAFLHLVALEKGLYKRWPFVLFRDLHLEHDACSNFLPPTTSTQLWNQVEEHSFFQRMWSWASETAKWMLLDASDEVPHYNSILHVLDVFMYHGCSYLYTYIYNILFIYTSCPCFTGIIKHLPELRTKIYARHLLFFPTICHHFFQDQVLDLPKNQVVKFDLKGWGFSPPGMFGQFVVFEIAGCCVNKSVV